MKATAIKRITSAQIQSRSGVCRSHSQSTGFLMKWGIFAVIEIYIALSVAFSVIRQVFWVKPLEYAGVFCTFLPVKRTILAVTMIVSAFCLWLNRQFTERDINLVDGDIIFNEAFAQPADASRLK